MPRPPRKGLTAALCAAFVFGMVGMAFAAVPIYRIFCQLTGYGGTTRQADRAPAATLDRMIVVRFDTNVANDLGWSFRPEQREMSVKLGEVAEATFVVENRTDRETAGVAAFNVSPGDVGTYFNKLSCFCFNAQTLKPHEQQRYKVVYFVDPAIVEDHELDSVDTVTLSYSFYPAAPGSIRPKPVASAAPAANAL
ncbi:MAG TPA: cytochrome c oxidase assembly protein [Bauldia sp.]|nr:cytochrome c oxidase assembly protein [Bauldia sp.]